MTAFEEKRDPSRSQRAVMLQSWRSGEGYRSCKPRRMVSEHDTRDVSRNEPRSGIFLPAAYRTFLRGRFSGVMLRETEMSAAGERKRERNV